jgi:hypothetical protein
MVETGARMASGINRRKWELLRKVMVERREALVLLAVLLIGIVTGTMFPKPILRESLNHQLAYAEGEVTALSWGAVPIIHLGIDLVLGERYLPTTFIELTTGNGKRFVLVCVEKGVLTGSYPYHDTLSGLLRNKISVIYRAYPAREVPWQDIVNTGLGPSYRSGFWGSDQIDGIVEALFVLQQ